MKPKLTVPEREAIVNRVLSGEEVAALAKEVDVSRILLYRWLKRYKKAGRSGLFPRKRHIERYWRQTPEKYEKVVLSLVVKHPEWGIRKLLKNVPVIGGKAIIGFHGIQNVLRRADLLTYEARLAYAQSQITPVVSVITAVLVQVSRFFAIPASSRTRIVRFAGIMSFSAFITVLLLGSIGLFTTSFAGIGLATKLGLVFAYLALFMGSVFLLYSFKYYITLAIVLSFSQNSSGLPKSQESGLLAKLLGLGNKGNQSKSPVGLEPNLDHITLDHYPFISVHIPFYNEKKVVERSIQAAVNFDYQGSYEVILCDDSTDETTTIISDYLVNQSINNSVKSVNGEGYTLTTELLID